MGGPGSTRWPGHRKKVTVEASLTVDLSRIVHALLGVGQSRTSGMLSWIDPETETSVSTCAFAIDLTNDLDAWVVLRYRTWVSNGQSEPVAVRVRLTATHQPFGGRRWWGHCPDCNRRVVRLLIPP